MVSALSVVQTIALFILAGIAEIGGGWLIFQYFRSDSDKQYHQWYYLVGGILVIVTYPFIPVLQPSDLTFGRIYAAYGGFFIILSLLWGWALDGNKPDVGDWIGTGIAVAGVLVILYYPRNNSTTTTTG